MNSEIRTTHFGKFPSYQAAGELWGAHDLTDYLDDTEEIAAKVALRDRGYQVEIEPSLIKEIRRLARRGGLNTADITNELLRKQLSTAD